MTTEHEAEWYLDYEQSVVPLEWREAINAYAIRYHDYLVASHEGVGNEGYEKRIAFDEAHAEVFRFVSERLKEARLTPPPDAAP